MARILTVLPLLLVLLSCGDQAKEPVSSTPRVTDRETIRGYHGAPPVIPHQVAALGRANCLSCHGPGQERPDQSRALAALTPHPEWRNCQQCHVEISTDDEFVVNVFVPLPEPEVLAMETPFLPPYIPHRIQDRDGHCESCHIGPQARPEIVPNHGPRDNCRQCHLSTYGETMEFGTKVASFP
ncbi:MAG: nitrate reductase cytochrome c-type subunit [Acidobacteria bacterium]|nr:nitrate reductase cytochrome c-type subunit [Acidobacteriota bacterium]